jgi:signal peptidase I
MNTLKTIWKGFYYLLIAVIALVAIFLILSAFPIKGGYKSFIVLSGSMEPKIKTGSVVIVKPDKEYQLGDVITFGENTKTKKPTTHRIVEIIEEKDEKSYVTKGDANNAEDGSPVEEDEILGKVLFSVPYFGYAVSAAQKPIGFMLIIVIPAVIIIYDELLNIKKEISKKIDYRNRMKKREKEKETDSEKLEDNKEDDDKDEEKKS